VARAAEEKKTPLTWPAIVAKMLEARTSVNREGAGADSPPVFMRSTTRQEDQDQDLISSSQTGPAARAQLKVLTERQYAHLAERRGLAVYEFAGRFWRNSDQFGQFFVVPIHWMAELAAEQARFATRSALGFKARVSDSPQNSGFFNLYLIEAPQAYGFSSVSSNFRWKIRKACRHGVQIDLATPELLEEHGYEVTREALEKSGYRKPPSRTDYVSRLENDTFMGGNRLVLAGLVPDGEKRQRLGAIATASAIDGTAYGDDIYVAPWARKSSVGLRIVYSFIEACQRTPGIQRIVLGRVTSDQALDAFKVSMGVPRKDVPARVEFRRGVGAAVKVVAAARPDLRQRLYGC
jgi:hypothetical protein